MNLSQDIKDQILNHAKEETPKECCGLIIIRKGRTKYIRCKNIAELPKHTFDWQVMIT